MSDSQKEFIAQYSKQNFQSKLKDIDNPTLNKIPQWLKNTTWKTPIEFDSDYNKIMIHAHRIFIHLKNTETLSSSITNLYLDSILAIGNISETNFADKGYKVQFSTLSNKDLTVLFEFDTDLKNGNVMITDSEVTMLLFDIEIDS
ncbi:MAG: hypothetical protein KAH18_06660 [Psychromonas sp.]|nr:hypothetical protein [Psychromonas sp.]